MRCNQLRIFFMVAALGMAAIGDRASAATVNYTIDSALSSLQVGVYLGGPPPPDGGGELVTLPQSLTSDTSILSGSLLANLAGGNISFPGGSNIEYGYQPGNYLPDANGGNESGPDPNGTGGAPAQIALQLDPATGLGTGYISIANAVSDITNATSSPSGTPITAGTFDATQQNVLVTAGNLAYWLNTTIAGLVYGSEVAATPTKPLSAQNGIDSQMNTYPQVGTVTSVAGITTITLPIFADQFVLIGSGVGIDIVFTGQIVATAASIPEPSTFVLAGIGLVGSILLFKARRRRKA